MLENIYIKDNYLKLKEGFVMTAKNTKKLTILHSNDLHGDFLAEFNY